MLKITDFRLAGFLVARGASFQGTEINAKGDVVFCFSDDDGQATEIMNQYPGSPEQAYDSACRTMFNFVRIAIKNRSTGR